MAGKERRRWISTYGVIDGKGQLTGKDITFVCQDFLTGLTGTFVNGVLKRVRAVDIVERYKNG
jgi:predicted methyltransferase